MLVFRVMALSAYLFSALAQAGSVSIELDNGDHLSGELIEQNAKIVLLDHPVFGKVEVPTAHIREMGPPAEVSASTQAAAASPADIDAGEIRLPSDTDESVQEDLGLFGTGWLAYWKRRLDLGVAGSNGNSDSLQVNLAFSADYESPDTRINHKVDYFRAESDHDLSDHSFYTSVNRDWLLPDSPWFRFAEGRFDIDQFKEWNYRINANGGVGYEFSNTPDWRVLGRSGLGFQRTFGGDEAEAIPEAMFGLETRWRMNNFQRVEFANTIYPNLTAPSELRNLTSLDWILDLNTYMGVALKVGLSNEYNSASDEEKENDFKYTASLAWTL